ncbi:MAG: calcium/sodium antiporter [Planctomycetota bacterium]|nr:calcium/sodium antiporter [Planctomycetota bacterium]
MAIEILLLIIGLALLYFGGEWLITGSVTLARKLGVAPLIVGLTVVAFGTSAPELFVNTRAALSGHGEISFGNIFGSNIANIALILGLCAIVRPMAVHKQLVRKTIPMLLAFTGLAIFMVLDPVRELEDIPAFTRMDGLILLALFVCFLYLTAMSTRSKKKRTLLPGQIEDVEDLVGDYSMGFCLLIIVASLGALTGGAELTVSAAIALARQIGISEAAIGLTVVAFGTSLPELAVGMIATRKGQADLAIGNVVGSNIFNLLLIMGVTSTISDVPLPVDGQEDLVVAGWLVVLLYLTALTQKRVARTEGWVLVVIYLGYTGWRFFASASAA